jgi:hypothetical protein
LFGRERPSNGGGAAALTEITYTKPFMGFSSALPHSLASTLHFAVLEKIRTI